MNLAVGDRKVAYEEWGDAAGRPVLLFHGAPGSRLFCPDERATRAAGVRLLTFDRPGYGRSSPQPGRTLLDTATDVAGLLDHCEIARCSVVGWSGGGPFAAATAFALGARVAQVAIVSAPGPLDEVPGGWEQLGDYQRPTATMARREPERSARAVARHMAPFVNDPPSFLGRGTGADGSVLHGAARPMLVAQVEEGLRQGAAGMAADLVAMWRNWGFLLSEVTAPVHVFHGLHDPHNAADAQCYATATPNGDLTRWPNAGHLGIVTHWHEVLASVG